MTRYLCISDFGFISFSISNEKYFNNFSNCVYETYTIQIISLKNSLQRNITINYPIKNFNTN